MTNIGDNPPGGMIGAMCPAFVCQQALGITQEDVARPIEDVEVPIVVPIPPVSSLHDLLAKSAHESKSVSGHHEIHQPG